MTRVANEAEIMFDVYDFALSDLKVSQIQFMRRDKRTMLFFQGVLTSLECKERLCFWV
jgi:hypothetical protein